MTGHLFSALQDPQPGRPRQAPSRPTGRSHVLRAAWTLMDIKRIRAQAEIKVFILDNLWQNLRPSQTRRPRLSPVASMTMLWQHGDSDAWLTGVIITRL